MYGGSGLIGPLPQCFRPRELDGPPARLSIFSGGVDATGDPTPVSLHVGHRKASSRARRQRGSAASVAVSASGNPVRPHSHPDTCHAPTSARREACPGHLHSKPVGVWQEHEPPTMRHGRDVGWSGSRHGQHAVAARTRSRRVKSHLNESGWWAWSSPAWALWRRCLDREGLQRPRSSSSGRNSCRYRIR